MKRSDLRKLERELEAYLDEMTDGLGRVERRAALRWYLTGLLLDGERKSMQPMAARLVDDPSMTEAMRQRMQQAVTVARWADDEVRRRLALKIERELPGVEALVVDDTGFPKKGKESVGVARQYSGTLGRRGNCQVATSLHLASEAGGACISMQLYLPKEWTEDRPRCDRVGVPPEVEFQEKWRTSLAQIDAALGWGLPKHVVLADAGYGDVNAYRDGLDERGLAYVVGINGVQVMWPPESDPKRMRVNVRGQTRTRWHDEGNPPTPVKELAVALGRKAYRKVTWRQGSRGPQSSRFAAVRVRSAHRHHDGAAPGDEQWLLVQWPSDEPAPVKYWLSTLPESTSLKELVRLAKLRWRIERDYQELKQEIGLDHYEGRTWLGFHHHVTLCSVAHGFLALHRALSPPQPAVDAAAGT